MNRFQQRDINELVRILRVIPIGQSFSLYSKKFLHLHTECSKFIDVSQTYFRLPNQPESTSQSSTFKKYIFFLNKLLSLGFHKKVSTN